MAARLGKPVSNFERSNSDETVRLSIELLSAAERPALSAVNHLGGRRTRLAGGSARLLPSRTPCDKSCYRTIRVITHERTYT